MVIYFRLTIKVLHFEGDKLIRNDISNSMIMITCVCMLSVSCIQVKITFYQLRRHLSGVIF